MTLAKATVEENELDKQYVDVLKYIGENPNNTTGSVSKALSIHRLKLESIFDKLTEKEYIKVNNTYTNGDKRYRIAGKGRSYLLDNNLI